MIHFDWRARSAILISAKAARKANAETHLCWFCAKDFSLDRIVGGVEKSVQ